ncbi:MAG: DUF5362 family protein [Paludibacteraceae bacterium]
MEENIMISSENQFKSSAEKIVPTGLVITPESEAYLLTTANWSFFLAIVGFVMLGITLLAGISMVTLSSFFSQFQESQALLFPEFPVVLGVICLLTGVLYFFPLYYLLLFSTKTKDALRDKDQVQLDKGFKNMKRLTKFTGIFTIVIICIYISTIIFSIIGATQVAAAGVI